MALLSLNLLGNFRATYDGALLPGFRTRKVQALLIYLAIEPQPQPRRRLIALLWPGLPQRSARANLRQILYLLRQAVPDSATEAGRGAPLLIANRHVIHMNPEASIAVDVTQFEARLDRSAGHRHLDIHLCPDCQADLSGAAALYRGHFLAGFSLDDSDAFEAWAHDKRMVLRGRAVDALDTLARIAIRRQEYAQALEWADRQLEIDSHAESAYCNKMEALSLSGRRREALHTYTTCRQVLNQALGMSPAARTTELYEQLLAGQLLAGAQPIRSVRGYKLQEPIAEGAYGPVYRAVQLAVGREVAVKIVRREHANDPEFIRRFEAEAQTIARLEHPHIVPLYDFWRDPDGAYLVMRYLRPGSLLQALKKGSWTPGRAVRLIDQIAGALATAHRRGVIHRNIKPGNILLDESGNGFLSDFSIATGLRNGQLGPPGERVQTPDYVTPEQLLNEPAIPQTDIYALGAVLYEILTGERPFGNGASSGLIDSHLNEPLPLVAATRPDVPAAVDAVLQKATAKKPSHRYQSVLEMATSFRHAVHGWPTVAASKPLQPAIASYNPYKGLRAFQEADAADFFGRQALVSQLVARLHAAPESSGSPSAAAGRFLAVVGPSGSGKSSVVKAGLIPALREGALLGSDKWFFAEMVPGSNPLEELAVALLPVAVDPPADLVAPMRRDTGGMLRTIRRILPRPATSAETSQLLLIIDQFEELFTLVESEEDRLFFLDSLVRAMNAPRSPLRVIITLRADFYDRPLQRQQLGQLLKLNTEIVLPLNPSELTWAIREPARRVGVRLEESLVGAIIADVGEQPGALPLLQYAMTALFDERQGQFISGAAYEAIGGLKGALGQRAEALFAGLDAADQVAAQHVFLRLVTLGEGAEDTRRRSLRSELEAIHTEKKDDGAAVATVLDTFGKARLLTFDRDPNSREPTVEVAHEALLREWSRLRNWLEESRADIRLQRQLHRAMVEWREAGEDDSYLLRGGRLAQVRAWTESDRVALNQPEARFLRRSLQGAEARQRRQRRIRHIAVGAVTIVAIVMTVVAAWANSQRLRAAAAEEDARLEASARATAEAVAVEEREEALHQAQLARAGELAASALASLQADPELSLILALRSLDITYTRQAEDALRQAMPASRTVLTILASTELYSDPIYSPDGTLLAALAAQGSRRSVTVWDAATGAPLLTLPASDVNSSEGCPLTVKFSPDGELLVMQGPDLSMLVLDLAASLAAGSARILYRLEGHQDTVPHAIFSPDGRRLVTIGHDNKLRMWDLGAGQLRYVLDMPIWWCASDPVFSPDGHLLAVRPTPLDIETEVLQLRDAASGRRLLSFSGEEFDPQFTSDGQRLVTFSGMTDTTQVWDIQASLEAGVPQQLSTFTGPSANHGPSTIGLSADQTRLAIAPNAGGLIYLYRLGETGLASEDTELEFTLSGHTGTLKGAPAFRPDGRQLATATDDGIRLWDIDPEGPGELLSFQAHTPGAGVAQVTLSHDGSLLATSGRDGVARIWDAGTGELIRELTAHDGWVNDITFSPDDARLATSGADKTARIWDATSGEELAVLEASGDGNVGLVYQGVLTVRFSPDGQFLATAAADSTIRVWDATSSELLRETEAHAGGNGATSAVFSPDGKYLALTTDTRAEEGPGLFRLWNWRTGEVLLEVETGALMFETAFSPDGNHLAVAGAPGMLQLWDLQARERLLEQTEVGNSFVRVVYSPDGQMLATAGGGGEAILWDAGGGRLLRRFSGDSRLTNGVAFSPDGSRLYTGGSDDGVVHAFYLDFDALVAAAHLRVTRSLRHEECRQYLHLDACPVQ